MKAIAKGLISFVPGTGPLFSRRSQNSDRVRYCYSVWMRHLVKAVELGLAEGPPKVVAELGPGDSLGTGIAALLSGADSYRAFDAMRFASVDANLRIFDELVPMFQERVAIPDEVEFPQVAPKLDSYAFPAHILTEERLAAPLDSERLEAIRSAIAGMTETGEQSDIISYVAPWSAASHGSPETVEMIFSQAVMEHVEDLEGSYEAMVRWLKPGGFISHQIDFKSHSTSKHWNGHWGHSKLVWSIIRGRRIYFINRAPLSMHLRLIEEKGLRLVNTQPVLGPEAMDRARLATEFSGMTDEDFKTSGALVQAKKH